jgi:hypothetical protein
MHTRSVGLAELLRPVLAIAEARAAKRGVTIRSSISPSAPRASVDPMHAQEAVTIALTHVVDRAAAGSELNVDAAEQGPGTIGIRVTGTGADAAGSLPMRLAERLIRAQGGSLTEGSGELRIELRAESLRSTSATAVGSRPA